MLQEVDMPLKKPTIGILERLVQRKTPLTASPDQLRRCLGVPDLVNSGFSAMVGAGIFVITPVLAANTTGPAITISYFIAGIATLLGALPYAELAARFDGIGSAYNYVYYVLGELAASTIGISMLMETLIGTASIMRSLSIYLDKLLFGGVIIAFETEHFAFNVPYLTEYADVFGVALLLVCGGLNLCGVKQTVVVSAVCNVVVIVSLVSIVIVGFVKGSLQNWVGDVDPANGAGGYAPFGFAGIFTGASLAYYSYSGFDCIASLGCEAKEPKRDIPIAICLSLALVLGLYLMVCAAITYIAPYYTLSADAGMAMAFQDTPWMTYLVSLGAVLATATGGFAAIMVSSRIIYSMAQDGILFKPLTTVSQLTQVPTLAIVIMMLGPNLGIIMLNIEELVMMNSGGMLTSFCLTNICVMVGRYQPAKLSYSTISHSEKYSIILSFLFWFLSIISNVCFAVLGLTAVGITSGIFFALSAISMLLLLKFRLTEVEKSAPFLCPLCPWLPALGIFFNSTLMVALPVITWLRVSVCLLLGLFVYFVYGLNHSNITVAKKQLSLTCKDINLDNNNSLNGPSFYDTDRLIGNES